MDHRESSTRVRTLHFHKLIHAPLPFVYRWCTDYRENDDRITESIYHYQARIVLRVLHRIVRIITVPGRDRNRSTEVETISRMPPNRWYLEKLSVTDDKTGEYRLVRKGLYLTALEMRFRDKWKTRAVPDRKKYRTLFDRVLDRYVEIMETEYGTPKST